MPEAASGPLVLDTHVWIWLLEGSEGELSPSAVTQLERASAEAGIVVPAICVWEVAMLEAKGRISLSRPLQEWVGAALTAPGVRIADLKPEIAIESARLPGSPPRDPADRLIIATARTLAALVMTCDTSIIAYGRAGHVRVRDGRRRR